VGSATSVSATTGKAKFTLGDQWPKVRAVATCSIAPASGSLTLNWGWREFSDMATGSLNTVTSPVTVSGGAADGAAVSGNPVLVAGQDGTNVQSVRTDSTGNVGVAPKATATAMGDATTNSPTLPQNESGSIITQGSRPSVFNGTTWDRQRGNTIGTNVQGSVASDAPVDANPLLNGGRASTPTPTAVSADGDAVALWVTREGIAKVEDGPETLANGAETAVSSTAVQVLAVNANRKRAIIQNVGANNVRVGITGVAATTGLRLLPNGDFETTSRQAIFAIRESADSTVYAQETT
jgi:hypothetical protein